MTSYNLVNSSSTHHLAASTGHISHHLPSPPSGNLRFHHSPAPHLCCRYNYASPTCLSHLASSGAPTHRLAHRRPTILINLLTYTFTITTPCFIEEMHQQTRHSTDSP
ncbi:hypothetical protein E2C01_035938 [Portunus trituberculatus]|uniref:Uncharacterized protein n=1 Tax=Portunus trituberculatus TaxID=210409 RepID=A0A5B7FAM9_PORTR|nr:hypothetical protein [Portunus trituberculatus]